VLACVEGEHHALGLRMAADALAGSGFAVDCLGASVPLKALARMVEDEAIPLVGVSLSVSAGVPALLRTGRALAAIGQPPRLFLGGAGVPESLRRLRDVPYARTTRDAVRAAERALHSRPPRPELFTANHRRRRRTDLAVYELGVRRDDEYQRLALEDPVTGVLNRRAFDERAAALGPSNATLLLFDLDGFGLLDDGDRVLRAVSDAVRGTIRADDELFRLGGDEFALLLAGTQPEEVAPLLERLRNALLRLAPPLTATFGVAPVAGDARRALHLATAVVVEAKAEPAAAA
jgi:diguanylate cyclase (GGDEF)-like protein